MIEDIFYAIYKHQNEAIDVIDGTFVSTMFNDLSENVVSIPRSIGLHDIHSSKIIDIPVTIIDQSKAEPKNHHNESVTDIIEYCFSEAAAKVASDELGIPMVHSVLNDRVEGVGMSQSMCSTYKMQKSPSRGTWSRIKRAFSSLGGRPSKWSGVWLVWEIYFETLIGNRFDLVWQLNLIKSICIIICIRKFYIYALLPKLDYFKHICANAVGGAMKVIFG